ncbi:hypothetical protein TgHK011_007910 [Trichoderma gracile]|nr:hypothetical protein TgHK011_007910 [Trichoderma gracile]
MTIDSTVRHDLGAFRLVSGSGDPASCYPSHLPSLCFSTFTEQAKPRTSMSAASTSGTDRTANPPGPLCLAALHSSASGSFPSFILSIFILLLLSGQRDPSAWIWIQARPWPATTFRPSAIVSMSVNEVEPALEDDDMDRDYHGMERFDPPPWTSSSLDYILPPNSIATYTMKMGILCEARTVMMVPRFAFVA